MRNDVSRWCIALAAAACLCVSGGAIAAEGTPASAPAKARAGRSGARAEKKGERRIESTTPGAPAREEERQAEPAPTFADVSYGPDESNKIDFWKAQSATPTPLVVFIHGGGFMHGDKADRDGALLTACLNSGISYASINYRLSGVAIYPAQMHDGARAIQFMRSKAAEWNIDPKRIACTGGSAGAGISEWLAFHDDLADPKSDDPVARQSTRLTCALPTNMQCTYDPREIKKIVPGNAYDVAPLKQLQGLPETFNWDTDPIDADLDARLRDCSPLTHLTKDDPPIFAMNNKANETDGNIHHPNFGRYLKKQMDAMGLECEFHLTADFPDAKARVDAMMAFLKKNFGMK
ncbi:MAG: alpha/beta hydrolase [Candidatus Sumerlaeota bacterium]|nr:alpha/beta hydrolase [Candidatus Sumerlaeota bacterium]